MLRVTAPATEIVRIGAVLRELLRTDAEGFDALFAPSAARLVVSGVDPALASELRAFGLVDGDDDALEGQQRMRRIGERVYVLELGDGSEYVQDVWPETDALVDVVARATAGPLRIADVGTGSGVLAIEAAARGHRVIATDLYDSALELARFNAILNAVDVDLRRGHLFEPLADGAFDLVVTAPHYGREADQLRLEIFADGPRVLAAGGRLVLASQLEWEGDGPLAVEPLLAAHVAAGRSVRIAPIDSALKRHWHARAVGDVPRLVSRWRFTVEIADDGRGEFSVARPEPASLPARVHVPLARLRTAPAQAAWMAVDGDDVAALSSLLTRLGEHELVLDAPLPARFLELCRFGARPCVAPRGQAAGAILDVDGGVRPCTHGAPLATRDDSLAMLLAHQQQAAARAFARRGCRDCAVLERCPRCLFPTPFADGDPATGSARADADQRAAGSARADDERAERAYCEFMRAHAATALPAFRRLVATLVRLAAADAAPPVRLRMWPRADRAGDDRVLSPALGSSLVRAVRDGWHASAAWLVEHGDTQQLFWLRDGTLHDAAIEPLAALVGAAIADGERPPLPDRVIDRAARRLAALIL